MWLGVVVASLVLYADAPLYFFLCGTLCVAVVSTRERSIYLGVDVDDRGGQQARSLPYVLGPHLLVEVQPRQRLRQPAPDPHILMMDQSYAGSAGIFSRRTNQTQESSPLFCFVALHPVMMALGARDCGTAGPSRGSRG
eukprot:4696445-Pyramimonas_sp.AAC.1